MPTMTGCKLPVFNIQSNYGISLPVLYTLLKKMMLLFVYIFLQMSRKLQFPSKNKSVIPLPEIP